MASLQLRSLPTFRFFLPQLSQASSTSAARALTLTSRQLTHPLIPALSLSIPVAVQLNIPSWIEGLWDSVLRAVPKKKTSHMKKRHRQMAGKALQDVTSLNKCSACGSIKRAHVLCPYCVDGKALNIVCDLPPADVPTEIRNGWAKARKTGGQEERAVKK